jgi:hypothetical protein
VPDEVNPGYVTCSACHRVVETGHVNRSGRCILCAGKTAAQLAAEEPAGHRMSEDGSVLVEPDPVEPESEKSAEEQHEP